MFCDVRATFWACSDTPSEVLNHFSSPSLTAFTPQTWSSRNTGEISRKMIRKIEKFQNPVLVPVMFVRC